MAPIALDMKKATRLTREGRLQEAMDLLRGAQTSQARPAATFATLDARLAPLTSLRHVGLPSGNLHHGRASVKVPDGARFEDCEYATAAGTRNYKVYVPSSYRGDALPLVVMLHGCTQDPEDFAAGTGMNDLAEELGFLVVYPAQSQAANMSRCWNWFNVGEQQRNGGEPSLIAGITREVMQTYAVRADQVYVAGLSAGGACASIMGATHPDLFAAIGVHSGLACGAARDVPSAFSAMKQGSPGRGGKSPVPTIVFHGDSDQTVHPANAESVIAHSKARATLDAIEVEGEANGRSYTRTTHVDGEGRVLLEQWSLHGAGHAWSGGNAAGSYTDPKGPNASREMVRFFLSHTLGERDG